jgi:hypothetical protein
MGMGKGLVVKFLKWLNTKVIKKMKKIIYIISLIPNLYFAQPTTYSISYGTYGGNLNNYDIQFQLECSQEGIGKERWSLGMKWRYLLSQNAGLNIEGISRYYFGKDDKMYASNDRWYLQFKAGYGIVKAKDDNYTSSFNEKSKFNFSPLAGVGLGYKFLIKEKVVIDFLLGYHYQSTPKFVSDSPDYTTYQRTKWQENLAFPIEFQWGIGFQID